MDNTQYADNTLTATEAAQATSRFRNDYLKMD